MSPDPGLFFSTHERIKNKIKFESHRRSARDREETKFSLRYFFHIYLKRKSKIRN